MQSILTRHLPATDFKQSRVRAITSSGEMNTIAWDWALDVVENHDAAARALIEKLGWHLAVPFDWYRAGARDGYGFVYVMADKRERLELRRPAIPSNWASDMDAQDFDCRR